MPATYPPPLTQSGRSRFEKDFIGAREIPHGVYWGIQTLRAVENFPITGIVISAYPQLVKALAQIKHAAVLANFDLGLIEGSKKDAIEQACREIEQGALHDQFVVDLIQGGAGTATNMNANEVIANRALELLGYCRGSYSVVHPGREVNMSQSTNSVYPTAIRIAAIQAAHELLSAMAHLRGVLDRKALELADNAGGSRTQLQDALPTTLGQDFDAYSAKVEEGERGLRETLLRLHEIDLGATAIGTGVDPQYLPKACLYLRQLTALPLVMAADPVGASHDCAAFVLFSGALKRASVKLSKICNDLRQVRSGIVPGWVNPVIPEAVNQIAFEVMGNDLTIMIAAEEAGHLRPNPYAPIIARSLFASLAHLVSAYTILAEQCIADITANRSHLRPKGEAGIEVLLP